MLDQLYIKDFALIRELRISLGSNLNLITGETGAGKSIILGALGLVLGSKATTDLIRTGASRSIVEAGFNLPEGEQLRAIQVLLDERGVEADESLILKREINVDGRGRSFINAQQVPVSLLRDVGRYVVDIHGQNEHQNIMQVKTHRNILDRYAGLGTEVAAVGKLYRSREELQQKLTSVSLDEGEKSRRLEILSHEINEIEAAEIGEGHELDDLISEEKTLAHAESIAHDLSQVHGWLQESEPSILSQLGSIESLLEKNSDYDDSLADVLASFREGFYTLQDVASEVRSRAGSISIDPERLAAVRERIDMLQALVRKYGDTLEDVLSYYEKACNEHAGIELSSEEEGKLRAQIGEVEKELISHATELSRKRRKAAAELEKKVQAELSELGMADTRLRISIKWEFGEAGIYQHPDSPGKTYVIHPTGLDVVEFLIAASEQDTLRPLRRIASGGEMSRLMLALKKVIIDSDPVPSMIFDEVDAGVGGRIAEAVGKKLASLAAQAQVLVITHLHQIAGLSLPGTVHYRVAKSRDEGTRIFHLNDSQRVEELARMIGGEKITESAINHARTLLAAGSK